MTIFFNLQCVCFRPYPPPGGKELRERESVCFVYEKTDNHCNLKCRFSASPLATLLVKLGTADGLYSTAQKIMHAPEVTQEVLALQEHASPSKK